MRDAPEFIDTAIAVGRDEVFSIWADLSPFRKQLSMLLAEPVHSEVLARKALLEDADVLQEILQPLPFHTGVGEHHIFRYAGAQQPFLLG